MAEKIDVAVAQQAMERAIAFMADETIRAQPEFIAWTERVARFSKLSADKNLKSYVAALGNAMLAKASNSRIDVFSLKASDKSPGAYDARRTAERVLVPASQLHRFSLGTTGAQPLNNQPFFRAHRIDSTMTVRPDARAMLTELIALLHELQQCRGEEATRALAAFVEVRRGYVPAYASAVGETGFSTWIQLAEAVRAFVSERSEGGARAQASVGGLLDVLYGPDRVRVGKRNEPDRQMAGDVGVRGEAETYFSVFEVRDKNVPPHAVIALATKAAEWAVGRATLVAVDPAQEPLDTAAMRTQARQMGVDLRIFIGWPAIIDTIVFATAVPESAAVILAASMIRTRLIELEVSTEGVARWDQLSLIPAA